MPSISVALQSNGKDGADYASDVVGGKVDSGEGKPRAKGAGAVAQPEDMSTGPRVAAHREAWDSLIAARPVPGTAGASVPCTAMWSGVRRHHPPHGPGDRHPLLS